MRIHVAPYRKILLANYLCIGFVPGGNFLQNAPQNYISDRQANRLSNHLGAGSKMLWVVSGEGGREGPVHGRGREIPE